MTLLTNLVVVYEILLLIALIFIGALGVDEMILSNLGAEK